MLKISFDQKVRDISMFVKLIPVIADTEFSYLIRGLVSPPIRYAH